MPLSQDQRKQYRAIAHHLKPVVIIAANGVTEGVINELERALNDHELIKIKVAAGDREERVELLEEVAKLTRSELVQTIGRVAVLVRKNPRPNPKLSNILRAQAGSN